MWKPELSLENEWIPLIFVDIDGVLNAHSPHPTLKYNTIDKDCAERFNDILEKTGANFVVTSAWRYMVHGGSMNVRGFGDLLLSHWVNGNRLVGITRKDAARDTCDRGQQITDWRTAHNHKGPYVVLDDMDLGITEAGHELIDTNPASGLTPHNVLQVVAEMHRQKRVLFEEQEAS